MEIVFPDERTCVFSEEDGGTTTNVSDDIVLLVNLGLPEIENLFRDFQRDLKASLLELFSMECEQIFQQYGPLGFRESEREGREGILFGAVYRGTIPRFINLRSRAVTKVLAEMGHIKPSGRPEERATLVLSRLPHDSQMSVFRRLVDEPFDEFLNLDSTACTGLEKVALAVAKCKSANDLLRQTAEGLNAFIELTGHAGVRKRYVEYGWAWFAQYLARRGIWLLPMRFVNQARRLYPDKLEPIAAWMSVDPALKSLADQVLSFSGGADRSTIPVVFNVFICLATCSDMFVNCDFRPAPFVEVRRAFQGKITNGNYGLRLSALNYLYPLVGKYFGVRQYDNRPEAPSLAPGKRLLSPVSDTFRWCFDPLPKNTKMAQRCLGRPIEVVPEFVQRWAADLEGLLPNYDLADDSITIRCLTAWLVYMMSLGEDGAPKSPREISKFRHVNDLTDESRTFRTFLREHFSAEQQHIGYQAMTVMEKAWHFAAVKGGYLHELANPFHAKSDRAVKAPPSSDGTSRPAMDPKVWSVLIDLNRRGFYQFASENKRYHYRVQNVDTQLFETVFFPLEAMVVDVILNSGARHKSGRWLDSGEGDERTLDMESMEMVTNPSPLAQKGRQKGVLQLVQVNDGEGRRKILKLLILHNKTGGEHSYDYVEKELAENIHTLIELQKKYNSIVEAVPIKDARNASKTSRKGKPAFPLFRRPTGLLNTAVTDSSVFGYWVGFLKFAQPFVDEVMGFHYPFFDDDGNVIFDIHSLRVAMVNNLLAAGMDIEEVRREVGHANKQMTGHYKVLQFGLVNAKLAAAHKRLPLLDQVLGDQGRLVPSFVAHAYHEGHEDGVRMFESGVAEGRTAPFDEFRHGVCPGAKCGKGGPKVNGKNTGTWRDRACSRCRFRVTGTMYIEGLKSNYNSLTYELRDSARRSRELNRRLRAEEAESGNPARGLRRDLESETSIRAQLILDRAAELKTIRGCEALRDKLASEGQRTDALIVGDGVPTEGFRLEREFAHDFQLLVGLANDILAFPSAIVEIPSSAMLQFREHLHLILRANGVDEYMFKLPQRKMVDIGYRVAELCGTPEKIQELIDSALEGFSYPGIAAAVSSLVGPNSTRYSLDGPNA